MLAHLTLLLTTSLAVIAAGLHAEPSSRVVVQDPISSGTEAPAIAKPQATGKVAGKVAGEGLIKLDIVVTDDQARPMPGLHPEDFTILEAGQPVRITSFQGFSTPSEQHQRLGEIIFFLDALTMSSRQAVRAEHDVEQYLRRNAGRLSAPTSLFWLGSSGLWTPNQAQPSQDGNMLAAALEHKGALKSVWWQPGQAIDNFSASGVLPFRAMASITAASRTRPGRKALFVIGPVHEQRPKAEFGTPQDRQYLYDHIVWFSTLLREARIDLYRLSIDVPSPQTPAVGVYSMDSSPAKSVSSGARGPADADLDRLAISVLAAESGGRALPPVNDLGELIERCTVEASSFYSVSFNPGGAQQLDEYHDLQVSVKRPGVHIRTSIGFYDQPYYRDLPSERSRPVTAEQLKQILDASSGGSDNDTAGRLIDLQLTERFSSEELLLWQRRLHGPKSRQALVVLADESAFLPPPQNEIPLAAVPDPSEQRKMLGRAIGYLSKMIPKLPNYVARRTVTRYEESPPQFEHGGAKASGYRPLHMVEGSSATVLYRHGMEVVDETETKHKKRKPNESGFVTSGTFGPILGTVVDAIIANRELQFSRWENGPTGLAAVFHYSIPADQSRYQVANCCLPDGDGTRGYEKLTGYHGEINVDPASGAVLRLSLISDLDDDLPLVRSDTLVEYGPVEIGGSRYICPLRSVSISRGRTVRVLQAWGEAFRTFGPFESMLNDVSFADYHLFRAEARLVVDPETAAPPK